MSSPATTEKESTGGGGSLRQEEITKTLLDGSVYRGPLRGGRPHGRGTLTVKNNVFAGTFVNGKFTGQGELRRANGERYRGQFVDRLAQGFGECTYPNGDVYRGTWNRGYMHGPSNLYTYAEGSTCKRYDGGFVNDKMHGRGRLEYADGAVYVGGFKKDKKNGIGEMTHPDGDKYAGSYKDDKYHGSGRLEEDGNVYTGNFVNGLYHGKGKMEWENGAAYEGGWSRGKYHGEGTLSDLNHKYEGSWVNGNADGKGKTTYSNGDTLSGNYKKGEIVEGTYTFVDGEAYVGQFSEEKYHGHGIFSYSDGSSYEGYWCNDEKHGKGEQTDANGNVLEGKWVNGKKHGAFISRRANGDVLKQTYRDGVLASNSGGREPPRGETASKKRRVEESAGARAENPKNSGGGPGEKPTIVEGGDRGARKRGSYRSWTKGVGKEAMDAAVMRGEDPNEAARAVVPGVKIHAQTLRHYVGREAERTGAPPPPKPPRVDNGAAAASAEDERNGLSRASALGGATDNMPQRDDAAEKEGRAEDIGVNQPEKDGVRRQASQGIIWPEIGRRSKSKNHQSPPASANEATMETIHGAPKEGVSLNESPSSRPRVDGNLQQNVRCDGDRTSPVELPTPQRSSIQPLNAVSSPFPMPAAVPRINHRDAGSKDPGEDREEAQRSRQAHVSNANHIQGDGNDSDYSDRCDYKALCMQLTEKVMKQRRTIKSLRSHQAEGESLQADEDDDDIPSLQMKLINKLHSENEKLLQQIKDYERRQL